MTALPHNCPNNSQVETWVEEGRPCPHGCGWTAAWSPEMEAYRVAQACQALDHWGPFVSLAEAAERCNIPLSTLAQAAREGRLPALEVMPGHWLVRIEAVEARIGLNPPGKYGPRKTKRAPIS